ncbi:hypothetical protein JFT91_15395 [Pseudomonas sp. TH08]|uniref:hypothetical protein n=1 Tax=Pseudomonas sp. TH08 TaxID=2796374 RepID=UPI001913C2F1|nr:hypothetical protein [Pseudomonas sp. TH08]MBK5533964.1 hypothetical protein [Pseudomonas sp. TH08]
MERIDLTDINLFIGSNGAGKSTVIDMVRALASPQLLPSLYTENAFSGVFSGFSVSFDKIDYSYKFEPVGPHYDSVMCQMLSRTNRKKDSAQIKKKKFPVFSLPARAFKRLRQRASLSGICTVVARSLSMPMQCCC